MRVSPAEKNRVVLTAPAEYGINQILDLGEARVRTNEGLHWNAFEEVAKHVFFGNIQYQIGSLTEFARIARSWPPDHKRQGIRVLGRIWVGLERPFDWCVPHGRNRA